MRSRRIAGRLAGTILVAAPLVAVAGAPPVLDSEAVAHSGQSAPHVVLALGDSVPAGTACDCTPFPTVYGSLLSRQTGGPVTVENEAVSGLDLAGLLTQLDQPDIVADVRRADVVLVTIGANDFAEDHDRVVEGACAATDCVSDEIGFMRQRLAKALTEIRTLRSGEPTSVLVTGYWNVFEDGEVAHHASGAAGLQASIRLTRRVNDAISSVSTSLGAHYVDLFEPFQRRGRDIDSLLAPDGDHPDAAGHLLIASALLGAGLPRMP